MTKNVYIFASYHEIANLNVLLKEFSILFDPRIDAVVIADDTGKPGNEPISGILLEHLGSKKFRYLTSLSDLKSGRGAAIRRGLILGLEMFPEAEFFFELDSDGSHRMIDLLKMKNFPKTDFLIGSRYLPDSEIVGWTPTRRAFSRFLNFCIPRILKIRSSDLTNGLRRYSRSAATVLCSSKLINRGFIQLTETANIFKEKNIFPEETPIIFSDRISGKSSVGILEILKSLFGLLKMVLSQLRKRNSDN
jgi:dolichol-phosphate mannosyltransferase